MTGATDMISVWRNARSLRRCLYQAMHQIDFVFVFALQHGRDALSPIPVSIDGFGSSSRVSASVCSNCMNGSISR